MFDAIERADLLKPGRLETDVDADIRALMERDFGVTINWHKRIARTGPNTVCTFHEKPPVRAIEPDDTVYLDLGPVFENWEADLGRSYALGSDPEKKRLIADLPRLFDIVRSHYYATPYITGAELYAFAQRAADEAGWIFGGKIAGHTIGPFPHVQLIPGEPDLQRIAPANTQRMRDPDDNGDERHWILEIHLVDKARRYGGFYERLL